MAMAFPVVIVSIIFFMFIIILPIALLVALQMWMCRKSLKLGLILPGCSLALSLLITLTLLANMAVSSAMTDNGLGPRILITIGLVLLVTNIPTVVFGGIWLHYKGRKDTLDDLKRMRIEDLE